MAPTVNNLRHRRRSYQLFTNYACAYSPPLRGGEYPRPAPSPRLIPTLGAGRPCTRCGWSDGAFEVRVRARIAMDRHMLGNIKLQPLDVVVERYRVRADIRDWRPRRRWPHVRIDENLRLRQIYDRHVACVIEAFDMVADDRLITVADRIPVPVGLELPWSGTRRRKWELRQPVRAESPRLRYKHDPFVELPVQVIRDHRGAFCVGR